MSMVEETKQEAPIEETQQDAPEVEVETGPMDEETEEEVTLPSDDTFQMPDKFQGKSAEEIARAYVELEKMKTTKTQTEETKDEEPLKQEEAKQQESNKYLDEFRATGSLSDESYKELEEQGYSKEQVDEILDYERYKQEKAVKEIADVVGGIENYTAMEQWATKHFSQEERAEFVTEFASAGTLAKKALLKDLYSKYKEATTDGDVVHTNEPQTTRAKGYTSQYELQQDMADPRYGTDRSYTKMVEDKLSKSDLSKLS